MTMLYSILVCMQGLTPEQGQVILIFFLSAVGFACLAICLITYLLTRKEAKKYGSSPHFKDRA